MLSKSRLTFCLLLLLISTFAQAGIGRKFPCQPLQRKISNCPDVQYPVCGFKPNVECLEDPNCGYEDFKNECEACIDPEVVSYTLGNCEEI